jgi:hypothetical protein
MQGERITPQQIKMAKATKSVTELMTLCKSQGCEVNQQTAEKLYGMLHKQAGGNPPCANDGGCFDEHYTKCPSCGQMAVTKRYLSTGLGTGNVVEYCTKCGWSRSYV